MTTFFWLILIYGCAVFFWLRFFYIRSLKTAAGRSILFESIQEIFLFVPIGMQGILLLSFCVIEVIPLSIKLSDSIELIFFTKGEIVLPDFESLKIIFIGALLLTLQYLLLRKNISSYKPLNILIRFSTFLISILFLRFLSSNIFHTFYLFPAGKLPVSYDNNFAWLLCIVLVVIGILMKGEWIYERQLKTIRYFSLASRIVMGYLLLVFIIALPLIIFTIIQKI